MFPALLVLHPGVQDSEDNKKEDNVSKIFVHSPCAQRHIILQHPQDTLVDGAIRVDVRFLECGVLERVTVLQRVADLVQALECAVLTLRTTAAADRWACNLRIINCLRPLLRHAHHRQAEHDAHPEPTHPVYFGFY